MKQNVFTAMVALLALTACGNVDTATRAAPATDPVLAVASEAAPQSAPVYALGNLSVVVPDSLVVSEANTLIPRADIVWRGDEYGDRHEQVKALFETAASKADLTGGKPVNVSIEVLRFHGLTEKARYVTGGIYAIHFRMALTDPQTGALIEPPRIIHADLDMLGGSRFVLSEANSGGEKGVVTRYLQEQLRMALGHEAA